MKARYIGLEVGAAVGSTIFAYFLGKESGGTPTLIQEMINGAVFGGYVGYMLGGLFDALNYMTPLNVTSRNDLPQEGKLVEKVKSAPLKTEDGIED